MIGTDPEPAVAVTVTNSFDPAKVLVNKVVTGDAAAYAPDSFEVQVTCLVDGEVLSGFPVTVTVVPGTPTEIDTLAGSTCSAGGRHRSGNRGDVRPGEPRRPRLLRGGRHRPDPARRHHRDHEYRAGGLQTLMQLDGPGASIGPGPFVFTVSCSFNGVADVYTDTVTLTRDGDCTSLTSPVLGPLPVGAVCDVVETDSAERIPPRCRSA